MLGSKRNWLGAASLFGVMQVVVLWPLVQAATAKPPSAPSLDADGYVSLGGMSITLSTGVPGYRRQLRIEPVLAVEGKTGRVVLDRLQTLRPKVLEEARHILARQTCEEASTLRGRDRLRRELHRVLSEMLATDEIVDVLFRTYRVD